MKLKFAATLAALLLAACASDQQPVATTDDTSTAGDSSSTSGSVDPGTLADFQVNVGDRVFFDFDSYELRPDAQDTLQRQAAWLQTYPEYRVVVEGHTDERGTREYNLALGERRSNAVQNYLVALGVDPARIDTISFGKEQPANPGSDEIAWAENRRGVTVLQ